MRRAKLTRRGYLNLALDLALSTEVAWPVLARLVVSRAWLDGRRLKLLLMVLLVMLLLLVSQFQSIEEVRRRQRALRKRVHPSLHTSATWCFLGGPPSTTFALWQLCAARYRCYSRR